MAELYNQISSNKRKTYFLILGFLAVIAALGYVFGLWIGISYFGIVLAVFFGGLYAVISYFAGSRMVLAATHARKAEKKEFPHLVHTVEGLAIAAGIPTPEIYVIDDSAINAFATGMSPQKASVTFTTGAIQRLNRTELEGVAAHELSHIKNFDIRVMLLTAVLVGVIVLLSDVMLRSFFYGGRRDSDNKGALPLILIGLVLAILAPIFAELMKLAVSRKREFLADASGAMLTRYPKGLADALKKIRDDKEPLVEAANKATAHLFIENPLRKFKGPVNNLFSTHPDINERIKKLDAM